MILSDEDIKKHTDNITGIITMYSTAVTRLTDALSNAKWENARLREKIAALEKETAADAGNTKKTAGTGDQP